MALEILYSITNYMSFCQPKIHMFIAKLYQYVIIILTNQRRVQMKKIFKRCLALILILSLFLTTSIPAVSVEQLNTALRNKYMILVNRNHKLSSDYVPTDLVYYKNKQREVFLSA